jgi:ketosteroid isomerase-like protein
VDSFDAVVEESHRALDAFFKGDANPVKPFSHRDDVTLANPFGPPQRGWDDVEKTMERAAANYRDGGVVGFEELSRCVTPELAYIVDVEHYQAKVGEATRSPRSRFAGRWCIATPIRSPRLNPPSR